MILMSTECRGLGLLSMSGLVQVLVIFLGGDDPAVDLPFFLLM